MENQIIFVVVLDLLALLYPLLLAVILPRERARGDTGRHAHPPSPDGAFRRTFQRLLNADHD